MRVLTMSSATAPLVSSSTTASSSLMLLRMNLNFYFSFFLFFRMTILSIGLVAYIIDIFLSVFLDRTLCTMLSIRQWSSLMKFDLICTSFIEVNFSCWKFLVVVQILWGFCFRRPNGRLFHWH